MQLQVKGKNLDVTPALRDYAERKVGKLARQLPAPTNVLLELAEERNPSIADSQVAEATIWTKGPVLRAREASPDMKASIDRLVTKLQRQVDRYRDKLTVEPRRGVRGKSEAAPAPEAPEAAEPGAGA
jgi:putative sigma-54 modulation protein